MKRWGILVVLALLGFLPPAGAQVVGLDFLGIRKNQGWDCDAMMRTVESLPRGLAYGAFLDDTFGTSDTCLRRLLRSGYVGAFRGHLAWTNHQPIGTDRLIPTAKRYAALMREFPGIQYFVSPVCEHYDSAAVSAARNDVLRIHLPGATFVDSGSRAADPRAVRECHGSAARCSAISLDGHSAPDVDVETFKRGASAYSLLWSREFNCRLEKGPFIPPPLRKDCPTQDQFNHIARMLYPQPPWPPGVPRLAPPEIWKPQADNHGGCKGKDCKPVAILNRRSSGLRILAMNGSELARAPYFGPFGRQHRYYSPLTAFQLGQAAEASAGSEFVMLDAPGYRRVVNAYRRGGAFR